MTLKKKEIFLLIFLIFLQSCSGGRIGNFLESSFNDLEKISKDEDLQNNLVNKKINKVEMSENFIKNQKDINSEKISKQKNKKINKVEMPENFIKNKKDINLEKISKQKNKKIKKVEKPENFIKNKKDINSEKIPKQKNNKIKEPTKNRNIDLDSYKIIFILKDVDPKDPTEVLSSILSDSEVNFEIEKIERILDSKK